MKNYTEDQYISIYRYIVSKDNVSLQKEFPELVRYKDTLYRILNTYFKKYSYYDGRNSIIDWCSNALLYIQRTNNKKIILNDKIIHFLGGFTDLNILEDFFNKYISIFYPEDMINRSFYLYLAYFDIVVKKLLSSDYIDIECVKNNERIMALLKIIEELNDLYYYSCMPDDYQELLLHVLACCYSQGTDYTLVYNYLKNPQAYIDKIVLKGYAYYDYNYEYRWTAESDPLTYEKAKDIFREENITIK